MLSVFWNKHCFSLGKRGWQGLSAGLTLVVLTVGHTAPPKGTAGRWGRGRAAPSCRVCASTSVAGHGRAGAQAPPVPHHEPQRTLSVR